MSKNLKNTTKRRQEKEKIKISKLQLSLIFQPLFHKLSHLPKLMSKIKTNKRKKYINKPSINKDYTHKQPKKSQMSNNQAQPQQPKKLKVLKPQSKMEMQLYQKM